jgi:thiol-disulfide isomerase/thioredoxin
VSAGAVVLIAAVAAALAFGLWRVGTDGRFRGTHRVRTHRWLSRERSERVETTQASTLTGPLADTPWADSLGERATLLQFSSAFCAPCRATRHVLGDIAERTPGVSHVEVDAESHLDVVRRLGILRTPTTLVLDAAGREVVRAAGAPRAEQVLAALARLS